MDSKRTLISWILCTTGLLILCFTVGYWQSSPTYSDVPYKLQCSNDSSLDFKAHHLQVDFNESSLAMEKLPFPPCDLKYSEHTCQDSRRARMFGKSMLRYRERHCPKKNKLLQCLILAPPNYKNPFRWPQSRDYAWYDNIPHKELNIEKAVQNWIQVEGNRFRFPGGGTMFPHGADAYIDGIASLIPLTNGTIRTTLYTVCGVASWGAYLLKRNILTMSFAPQDSHEAQVQFALERGIPAMIGIMASERIPYPARAFDMAHFTRCLIPWTKYVLRPGGYWILSGPPINWKKHYKGWQRTEEDLKHEQDGIEDLAKRLCWKKVIKEGDLAIWQKPINHIECLQNCEVYRAPPICEKDNPDYAWYKEMKAYISPLPRVKSSGEITGGDLPTWLERALVALPRIKSGSIPEITADKFNNNTKLWEERLKNYHRIVPPLTSGRYRNVMDMNATLGGFTAALLQYPLWVMNVVPSNTARADTLGVIYERGLIGTYHDWCEAFSTQRNLRFDPHRWCFHHLYGQVRHYVHFA